MACQTVCKLCNRLIISTAVTYTAPNLIITIPAGSYNDGEKYCIVVAQSIPTTTTINESDISNSHSHSNTSLFKKNPNLKFKLNIVKSNNCFGFNDLFEVYQSKKNNCQYFFT